MLPKKEKFTAQDFANKSLFKSGKKVFVGYGFFIQTPGGLYRKGIVLSKKNFKTAVLRNKYKRLFYNTILEIYKEHEKEHENVSFVFYPKKTFSREELKKDLLKLVL